VTTVKVALPEHLRTLARVAGEVEVEVAGRPTVRSVLDAIESRYPMLRGTIRDHETGARRAYLRYFAGGRDLSHEAPEQPLPDAVASGAEALYVMGAISGG
jgi:sulfur-carrier protein